MWAIEANKKLLLDIFGQESTDIMNKVSQVSVDILKNGFTDDYLLIWAKKPIKGDIPTTIIVHDHNTREFIAWATTTIGGYRPFTAFFKVMDRTQAEKAFKTRDEPRLDNLAGPLTGLIIGEALTHSTKKNSIQKLSLLPCKSTYSFSLAKAYALGYYLNFLEENFIHNAWKLARSLTRQPIRKLSDEQIKIPFNVVVSLNEQISGGEIGVPEFVIEACRELFLDGRVKKSWRLLNTEIPFFEKLIKEMEGTREKRVLAFEEILKSLTKFDSITASFLTGLLASQISQGTFEHIDLITPLLSEYQMALVWYGICVGLHPNTEVQESADCLGRWIVRELLYPDPVLSLPKYDISVGELEVCLDRDVPINFRVASLNHISVEIVPGVPAIMKWPIDDSLTNEEHYFYSNKYLEKSMATKRDERQSNFLSNYQEKDLLWKGENAIFDIEQAVKRMKTIFEQLNKWKDVNSISNNKEKIQKYKKR